MSRIGVQLARLVMLGLICAFSLQVFFFARIGLMAVLAPQSTTFQRSEAWRLISETHQLPWRQQWVDAELISHQLKRAVIASEDAGFTDHSGVEWEALEKAWEKNQRNEQRAEKINERREQKPVRPNAAAKPVVRVEPKVVGGSTITQQLAKNLFLASERNFVRKGQEFVITFMLEAVLSKERILEIYLNNVEWGEGIFGAQAASEHYFRLSAANLGSFQAAKLAVMLPAPKKFEKRPNGGFLMSRAATIQSRMSSVDLP